MSEGVRFAECHGTGDGDGRAGHDVRRALCPVHRSWTIRHGVLVIGALSERFWQVKGIPCLHDKHDVWPPCGLAVRRSLSQAGDKSVRSGFQTFKTFLTAEEVPRWFGLSIVLIYLVGLGAVSRFGIVEARREATGYYERSTRYAVNALVDRLTSAGRSGAGDRELEIAYRLALRDFALHVPARSVRILDGNRRVIASLDESEVGTVAGKGGLASVPVRGLEISSSPAQDDRVEGGLDRVFRARLALAGPVEMAHPGWPAAQQGEPQAPASPTSPDTAKSTSYLEVRLPSEARTPASVADDASTLTVVLVVLGALFLVYRCLREQLRGMSRIAQRLESHRDRIEENLASLRILDTADTATSAWNELIDLTQSSLDAVQHSQANVELSRVLERSSGGALSEALNAIPDGLVYITDEVRFEYLNSTACRLFGWAAAQVKEMTVTDAQATGVGGQVLDVLRAAAQPDGAYTARTEVLQADERGGGDPSTYRVWVIPLRRAHHQGECVVVIRDVSQQMRAERAREEFVTQVTHELRTPLTNIRAYAETLSSGMFDDPKVVTECYNVITKETRRLSRLIEDILSISQLEVGCIELHVDQVDLRALMSEGVRDVRGLADEKNIDVQLLLPSKLEPIRGDRDKLAVVVNNLLGNAIKYTPPDGEVTVGCQVTGDEVALTFKDNGIGIAPADHARVFEKFQRADDPEIQKETGSGIGLYTAREIVRRHGGDIELISAKGEGATFMVRLPHRETRASSLSTSAVPGQTS